jgi:hypothetical protein
MPKRNRNRPFSERIRTDKKTGELVEGLSLRERFPDYLRAFALGVAVTAGIGLVLWQITSFTLEHAIGYTWLFTGVLLWLVGGARGGGYTNLSLGAAEALVGGRNRMDDDYEDDDDLRHGKAMKRRDPMDRLRRGLRPPPNPTAFWQIIAGAAFIGLGLFLTL